MPFVSVVIPTFNRGAALSRAVASVLDQTIADLEVVVVIEQGDVEGLPALAVIGDPRVRYVWNPVRRGAGVARDTGVDACHGKWVAFLDDDDVWLPTKLEKQLIALGDHQRAISITQSYVVGSAGSVVLPAKAFDGRAPIDEWLFDRLSWFRARESMVQTSSLMVPRTVFDELRLGPSSQHEEWEFVIKAVKHAGYELVTVMEPLVVFYVGRVYAWEKSTEWIESMRELVSPRAYSGFLLTVVTQGLPTETRPRAVLRLLTLAVRHGRPTARQLFAFGLICLLPHDLRKKVRAAMMGVKRESF